MIKKTAKGLLSLAVIFYFLFLTLFGLSDYFYPDNILRPEGEMPEEMLCFSFEDADSATSQKVIAFGFLPVKNVNVSFFSETEVLLGGELFGVRIQTDGLLVTALDQVETENGIKKPAVDAGLQRGDIIRAVDGIEVKSAPDFSKILSKSAGKAVSLEVSRGTRQLNLSLTAAKSSSGDGWKGGLWVRDGAAGIGTVTLTDPKTGIFAGLGHGVCDSETGTLFPLESGEVCRATVENITKGKRSTPGELKGALGLRDGKLLSNTNCGVYGSWDSLGEKDCPKTVKIAPKSEVKTGKAQIFCTLDKNGKKEYEIEIEEIIGPDRESKNFIIRVTDEELIQKTGGIIQGMSGSPIVQNGKLVGAVTHVLVDDPTRGYGIFIENMLSGLPE
ncbi:MAG: SpoIVB peptidase [Clostridia bacterium]|nr:SpoIVB peptidase [Clostridia bacterium]